MNFLSKLHNTNPKLLTEQRVLFQEAIPTGLQISELLGNKKTLLIYDKNIQISKKLLDSYDFVIAVKAGEILKTINCYQKILDKITKFDVSAKQLVFVAMGGGSVGDFVGFVASTYKRGCALVHIPSTWLAAVDSSHGGKTALNLNHSKNQIGSFYFANAIIISKKLLQKQPKALLSSAMGEVSKTYLYDKEFALQVEQKISSAEKLFEHLPILIKAKYKIIKKDPFEIKKIRKTLNLGHTFGHIVESYYKLPHGEAIKYGIAFSLNWSLSKAFISHEEYEELQADLKNYFNIKLKMDLKPIPKKEFLKLLKQDKKSLSSSHIDFVFVHKKTRTKVKAVSYQDLMLQAEKQGWLK